MRYLICLSLFALVAGCHGQAYYDTPSGMYTDGVVIEESSARSGGTMVPSTAMGPGVMHTGATSQIQFTGPEGMEIRWDVTAPGAFDSAPLYAKGRFDFPQGAVYRLQLTGVAAHEGRTFYPTLEVAATTPKSRAFLEHNAVPVNFTDEDFTQASAGNLVTKVIFLPDPEFQDLATAGIGTLVSTRLDPGINPIVEADRQGTILAVVRIGNKMVPDGRR
ncbi:MAG: hypothetical protein Q4C47_01640 [Planctomycetia bacterium]|nr:hypothetical protein [Planctomycetia bacterium]